ncbi:FlhC family transcriptional regulator [Acidithiobacillus sulfuriphilus]|uniref:FlhC family transcriptional regulator n=1 Tax=Acidithiobacillus sulfuriphilus TaxID=1867749 RepID=A0ACD5HV86_9PROT|nr:FlhC family transcriptional regulator [Acidithiobacillus sulfuriphilus]
MSDGYESIEKLEVAALLIAGGVRPTNVEAVTKVCKHRLGSLWKEMHGHPAKGQTPAFAYTFLRSGHLAKQAGLFIQCFLLTVHQVKHTEISRDDPKLFLSAFGLFHSLYSPWRSLRMEQAFYVWRDFRKGALQTKFCSRCQADYVYSMHQDAPDCLRTCQHCRSIAAAKKKSRPRRLARTMGQPGTE